MRDAWEAIASRVIDCLPECGGFGIQRLSQIKKHVVDLHWLAFLLTGNHEASADVTIQSLNVPNDPHWSVYRDQKPAAEMGHIRKSLVHENRY
jgi:hypothetical protein